MMPTYSMRQLLEAGVHFGHHTRRWNPKMKPFLFGVRNGIHIINLEQTAPMLGRAMEAVREVISNGGRVLFVGTKRQAQDIVRDAAERCGQYYVNQRWLGGMLTNWKTISNSIKKLREIDARLAEDHEGLTKREVLELQRHREKLNASLGGIKDMGGLPSLLFIIDTNKEANAIMEAKVLGIPVIAVIDSNSDPTGVDFPIPGNDDALRAIEFYCDMIAGSVVAGLQAEQSGRGRDLGESIEAPVEALPEDGAAAKA